MISHKSSFRAFIEKSEATSLAEQVMENDKNRRLVVGREGARKSAKTRELKKIRSEISEQEAN